MLQFFHPEGLCDVFLQPFGGVLLNRKQGRVFPFQVFEQACMLRCVKGFLLFQFQNLQEFFLPFLYFSQAFLLLLFLLLSGSEGY